MDDVSLYINFALHAVFGRLAEADTLMRMEGAPIRRVADYLAKAHPLAPKPIYRGMLLDPTVPFEADSRLTFLSWTEDRTVAQWFACQHSVVSEPLMQKNPEARGYLVTIAAPRSRVLFHHSWASVFDGLSALALKHPFMGEEGERQIAWSLRTQREVITEPVAGLIPEAADELDATTFAALERRLAPPWIQHEPRKSP